jgi:hypothetical protein
LIAKVRINNPSNMESTMAEAVIYAVEGDKLFRYLDNGQGDIGPGTVIGTGGWSQFTHLFSGVVGEIFALTADGKIKRYFDKGGPDIGTGAFIGNAGWTQFSSVFYGGNNLIQAITPDGKLRQYIVNGDADMGPGVQIGSGGWQNVKVIH